jgi:hypothetical protein
MVFATEKNARSHRSHHLTCHVVQVSVIYSAQQIATFGDRCFGATRSICDRRSPENFGPMKREQKPQKPCSLFSFRQNGVFLDTTNL